jgi:hypothetical protein
VVVVKFESVSPKQVRMKMRVESERTELQNYEEYVDGCYL